MKTLITLIALLLLLTSCGGYHEKLVTMKNVKTGEVVTFSSSEVKAVPSVGSFLSADSYFQITSIK